MLSNGTPETHLYDEWLPIKWCVGAEYRLRTLRYYVLVSQDKVFVEHHTRQPNGTWLLSEYTQLTDQLPLVSVEISIPLSEVYEGVDVT